MRVAVFGATGTVGQALLPRLVAKHEVTAVSRQPTLRATASAGSSATSATRRACATALDGIEVVYYLVHSLGTPDLRRARPSRRAQSWRARPRSAGVRQIVYLGGLGLATAELSEHLRSRRETERALASGATPVTAIRRRGGDRPRAAPRSRRSWRWSTGCPAMVCPRWVSTPTQPIALDDVVTYLAAVCGLEAAIGQTFAGGRPRGHDLPQDDRADRRASAAATRGSSRCRCSPRACPRTGSSSSLRSTPPPRGR